VSERRFSFLALPVVAVMIGALTIGLVLLGRYLNLGIYTLLLLGVPIALAVAYLVWYSKLPYEPLRARVPVASSLAAPGPDEPFEDPVEEADRLDAETKAGPDSDASEGGPGTASPGADGAR